MSQCNACEGNVSHGKTCHRCGRKGPLGQGWQMRAMELEAEIVTLKAQFSAPLRLGRGPTLEEVRAHADVAGKWLFSLTIDDNDAADSAVYWEQCAAWVVDGVIHHDSIITGGRIVDAIPLNAARQPCRVGEGT